MPFTKPKEVFACFFCLNQNCAELRHDKKSRPYITCRLCGTISFIRISEALNGLRFFTRVLPSYREQVEKFRSPKSEPIST